MVHVDYRKLLSRWHPLIGLLLLSTPPAAASEFTVQAASGELVAGTLSAPMAQQAPSVRLLDRQGRVLRHFQNEENGRIDYQFIVANDGPYRLQPEPDTLPWQDSRSPSLSLQGLNYPIAEDPPLAPQLLALQALPEQQRAAALPEFWQQIAQQGTPLQMPLPSGNTRLTFLWRGVADTHNVRLYWPAQSANLQPFARLAGTDIWYLELEVPAATRAAYRIAPNVPAAERPVLRRVLQASAQADPLNPLRWQHHSDAGAYDSDSLLQLADAPAQPWSTGDAAVVAGQLEEHRIASTHLGNQRRLSIYLPHGYDRAQRYPLLLVFDRQSYLREARLPATLDRLIAAGKIPPLVAVLIDNPSSASRSAELPCNPDFAAFMSSELLPWLHQRWSLSHKPDEVVLAGASYGGLAAACLAWRHPEHYGRVLAQSGSFWWGPNAFADDPARRDGGWLTRQFAQGPRKNLVFYLQAGLLETRRNGDSTDGILESSRALAEQLRQRGYTVKLHEYAGGHDYAVWREGIADGLIYLLGK